MNNNFTHLHVHTYYSLLDGFASPLDLATKAKELGMDALAITDHNHLLGVEAFQKACKSVNIKPLLGYEAYYTKNMSILSMSKDDRDAYAYNQAKKYGPRDGFDIDSEIYKIEHPISARTGKPLKEKKITKTELNQLLDKYSYDTTQYHLILIAKNQNGWKNIVKIQSESSEYCTFNGRYLCDLNLLKKYHEDIICTTACIGSYFAQKIIDGDYESAENEIKSFHDIFKDDFYLEIQPLNIPKQHVTNYFLIKYAKKHNIKLIASNDVHYINKSDEKDHEVIVNMGFKKTINTKGNYVYQDNYLKSYYEMIESFDIQYESMQDLYKIDNFSDIIKEALANTNSIAEKVESIELGSPVPLFPKVDIPNDFTPESYLIHLCINNLFKYKNSNPNIDLQEYSKRLIRELYVINLKGFAPYLLTVYDYVNYCRNNKIGVGPGRGSAAGSLCLFLLNITSGIDPIEYNLSFERFLTIDRTSPPDIDLDFSYRERASVIEYFKKKYGYDKVSSIGNITYSGVKSGIKNVARYLDIPFDEANRISKKIDDWSDKPGLTFSDLEDLKDSTVQNDIDIYREYLEYQDKYPELFRLAKRIEHIPLNVGVHASGILISPLTITDILPTRKSKDDITVILYEGSILEELNFIKFDILGLANIDIIADTLKMINPSYSYYNIYDVIKDMNDKKTFELIDNQNVDGLFQLESDLFKHTIGEMIPNNLNDIAALNAICRPGPLSAGLDKIYNATKNNKMDLVEPLPNTLDIVKDTYGALIYQEQVMAISVKVCGFNANQSDSITRKIIAKKKQDKLYMLKRMMIYGKVNTEGPDGWQTNDSLPWYDPNGKQYGDEICGAVAKGYSVETMDKFFQLLMGFASYCFNKSHAVCYGYLGYITGYLKAHYPAEFMTSLLGMQSVDEKISNYISVAKSMNISIKCPTINISSKMFSYHDNSIYYGLSSIKGVGDAAVAEILSKAPYESLEDFYNRINRTVINKRVLTALAKSGYFDTYNDNRNTVLKTIAFDLRKDKEDDYEEDFIKKVNSIYTKSLCIEYEKETLSASVSYTSEWDKAIIGDTITIPLIIKSIKEKTDKNGKLMAFCDAITDGSNIRCIIFSSTYAKQLGNIDLSNKAAILSATGKKNTKTDFIINNISV